MQKKLVISCVCAISLTSIGVAGVYGKAEYDRLNNKIELKTKAVKELSKQKQNTKAINSDLDSIKILNAIHVQPSQSFFAYQHERFSRLLQALFPTRDS